jgi:predicted DNA-binding antitoxin AbrB/MazE fold protein
MAQRLRAKYQGGAFVPDAPFHLPEGAEVELIVEGPTLVPPEVTDPEERARILDAVIRRMQENPIPPDAPPLTREALHERR